jgi:hypothetical protein
MAWCAERTRVMWSVQLNERVSIGCGWRAFVAHSTY